MSGFYTRGKKRILDADIDFLVDTIKFALIDLNDIGKVITGATNATPIVITSTAHGFANGDIVTQSAVGGNTAANGRFKVANQTANTYELTDPVTNANVAGNGAYTSGGFAAKLNGLDFVSELAAAGLVSRSAALGTKTTTDGVFDCADFSFTAVTGDPCEALLLYRDSGADASSALIALIDVATSGLPVTPNGGNIDVTINASGVLSI